MKNLFINLCKLFKFVKEIVFEKMAVVLGGHEEETRMDSNHDYLGIRYDSLMRKFSLTDLPGICCELERIIDYLRNSTNIEYFLYDYPEILEERFTTNVGELESLLKEIKSVNSNIQQQNQQLMLFTKEKGSLKRALKKLKENEIREMETVVSLFDKAMFTKWENVKSTSKPEVLERFLSDVMSKQLALENLNTLAARKLTNLRKYPKGKSFPVKKNENTETPTPSSLQENKNPEISVIPPPPPLPASPPWISMSRDLSNYDIQAFTTYKDVRVESLDEELD